MFQPTKSLLRNMLILSENDVRQCFPVSTAIAANRKALSSLRINGDGGARVPTRIGLPYFPTEVSSSSSSPADWSLFKPAAYYPPGQEGAMAVNIQVDDDGDDEILMGMKLVSIRANNPKINKPTVPATIMLVHAETGEVSAIVAATYLTAARTAAGSALATEMALSHKKKDGFTLVVFGAGLQAELHIRAISHVVAVNKVIIVNRSKQRAEHLKETLLSSSKKTGHGSDLASCRITTDISTALLSDDTKICNAVQQADIIVTATNTCTPLFSGQWLQAGCHINGVGSYTPLMQEVDEDLVKRCEVIIDTKEALEVGDLSHLERQGSEMPLNCVGLIGDALAGKIEFGQQRDDNLNNGIDCTFFKSVGTAIQDVVSAHYAFNFAIKNGIGTSVDM